MKRPTVSWLIDYAPRTRRVGLFLGLARLGLVRKLYP